MVTKRESTLEIEGASTVLLSGGIIIALALLRTAPADMRALGEYVARRAVDATLGPEET